jgi:hypothetical protein
MFSWINIVNPSIEQLDADSYRFRVQINWGGDVMLWNDPDPFGPPPNIEVSPVFNYLELSLLGDAQYNPTLNYSPFDPASSSPGNWFSQSMYNNFGMHGAIPFESNIFGYDFDISGPLGHPLLIDYNARIEWSARWDADHRFFAEEWHDGSFQVGPSFLPGIIPESPTVLLLSLGLIGFGVVRLFRS